jgi:hypothetical protein
MTPAYTVCIRWTLQRCASTWNTTQYALSVAPIAASSVFQPIWNALLVFGWTLSIKVCGCLGWTYWRVLMTNVKSERSFQVFNPANIWKATWHSRSAPACQAIRRAGRRTLSDRHVEHWPAPTGVTTPATSLRLVSIARCMVDAISWYPWNRIITLMSLQEGWGLNLVSTYRQPLTRYARQSKTSISDNDEQCAPR